MFSSLQLFQLHKDKVIWQVVCFITCSYFSHRKLLSWHHVLWSQGTSRAGCPNRQRVESPGHLGATLPLYLNMVGRAGFWWQGPWQSLARRVMEQVQGSPKHSVHSKRRWSQGLNKTKGSIQETRLETEEEADTPTMPLKLELEVEA